MVEYCELAPNLKISRILMGLWQIADMEKGGTKLDPSGSLLYALFYLNGHQ